MKKTIIITAAVLGVLLLIVLLARLDMRLPGDPVAGGAVSYKEIIPGDYYIGEMTSFGFSSEEPKSGEPYQLGFYQIADKAYYEALQKDYGADRVRAYLLVARQDTLPAGAMTPEAFDEAGTVYTKNEVKPTLYQNEDSGAEFYLLRYFMQLSEEDYGKRYACFGLLEVSDGTRTARYYSAETEPEKEISFPSVSFVMEQSATGAFQPNLQLFTTVSRSVYDNLLAQYGSEHIRMESVCELSRFALRNNRICAEAFDEKYAEVEDWQKVTPATFTDQNEATYTFGGAIRNQYFNAYAGVVFPYAFFEVTDESGTPVKRVYGTTEVEYGEEGAQTESFYQPLKRKEKNEQEKESI